VKEQAEKALANYRDLSLNLKRMKERLRKDDKYQKMIRDSQVRLGGSPDSPSPIKVSSKYMDKYHEER